MKEFEFKGKNFSVQKGIRSTVIETDDFIASLNELRVLSGLAREGKAPHNAKKLNKSTNAVNNQLYRLRRRNEALTGERPTTTELAMKADKYELLNEFTLLGLEKEDYSEE